MRAITASNPSGVIFSTPRPVTTNFRVSPYIATPSSGTPRSAGGKIRPSTGTRAWAPTGSTPNVELRSSLRRKRESRDGSSPDPFVCSRQRTAILLPLPSRVMDCQRSTPAYHAGDESRSAADPVGDGGWRARYRCMRIRPDGCGGRHAIGDGVAPIGAGRPERRRDLPVSGVTRGDAVGRLSRLCPRLRPSRHTSLDRRSPPDRPRRPPGHADRLWSTRSR